MLPEVQQTVCKALAGRWSPVGKALGWAVLAEAGGSLPRPRQAMAPAILCGQRAPGQSAEGETSVGGVPPIGHVTSPGATSSRKPTLVFLAGWGTSPAPGPALPCRHRLSLGGLSPWRLGTVCGPWLCVRWGALHGSESWSSTEKRVTEPKEVGSAGGRGAGVLPCPGGHPQGPMATRPSGEGGDKQEVAFPH